MRMDGQDRHMEVQVWRLWSQGVESKKIWKVMGCSAKQKGIRNGGKE